MIVLVKCSSPMYSTSLWRACLSEPQVMLHENKERSSYRLRFICYCMESIHVHCQILSSAAPFMTSSFTRAHGRLSMLLVHTSTTISALSYAESLQDHRTDFCCSIYGVSFFSWWLWFAGDFIRFYPTLATFIWRVAEGSRRCQSHPCCLIAWSLPV